MVSGELPVLSKRGTVFSACGAAISVCVHLASQAGLPFAQWMPIALLAWAGAAFLPVLAIEQMRLSKMPFRERFRSAFLGWQPWAKSLVNAMTVYGVCYFLLFLYLVTRTKSGVVPSRVPIGVISAYAANFCCYSLAVYSGTRGNGKHQPGDTTHR